MTIREQEDSLFQRLRSIDPDVATDGLVDEAMYQAAPAKVIYILKEVNGGRGWDLRQFLKDGGRAQTWDTVARWTEAILKCDIEREWTYWEANCEKRRKDYLPYIGVVNLKKTPGRHTSIPSEVRGGAQLFRDTVRAQVDLYAPQLVICGGTSSEFCKYCFPDVKYDWRQTTRGVWYADTGKFILVSYSHPEARIAANLLHYPLVEAVHEILSKNERLFSSPDCQ